MSYCFFHRSSHISRVHRAQHTYSYAIYQRIRRELSNLLIRLTRAAGNIERPNRASSRSRYIVETGRQQGFAIPTPRLITGTHRKPRLLVPTSTIMDNTHTDNSGPSRQDDPDPEHGSTPEDILMPIVFSYVYNAYSKVAYNHLKVKHGIPSQVLRQSLRSNTNPEVNDLYHAILDAMMEDEADVLKLGDSRCANCGRVSGAGEGWTVWFTHAASAKLFGLIHTWVYFVCGHLCDRMAVWVMLGSGPPGHGISWFWPNLETVIMWRDFNRGVRDTDDSAPKVPGIVVTQGD